jgi:cyclically-permuted mutarotase family protein
MTNMQSPTKLYLIIILSLPFLGAAQATGLIWDINVPRLPPGKQQIIQEGVAGAFSGVLLQKLVSGEMNEILILAGGTNFSKQPLVTAIENNQAPEKIYHKDIFLLKKEGDKFNWSIANIDLPIGSAYGASINTSKGILLFGGEQRCANGQVVESNSIKLLTLQNDNLAVTEIADMPFTFSKGASAHFEGKVYIVGGIQNGSPSNEVHVYDIDRNLWNKLKPYPGAARVDSTATISTDDQKRPVLFLFSGSSKIDNKHIAQTDGWAITLSETNVRNSWRPMATVSLKKNSDISLLGASSIKISAYETLFLGGYNKQIFDSWLETYQRVLGTEQEKQTQIDFFSKPPEAFKWNKQALVFNSLSNQWSSLGELPFAPNCGAAIQAFANGFLLLNGEIKPGLRTSSVKYAEIH